MKYGTIPIVRATGGLKDTVIPFDQTTLEGTGFSFEDYSSEALLIAISKAIIVYKDSDKWAKLVQNAMSQDFSWKRSAKEYINLYKKALGK